jgi:hypothetical protein
MGKIKGLLRQPQTSSALAMCNEDLARIVEWFKVFWRKLIK